MLKRCRDKSRPEYKWYGGRGITVCDRWKLFRNFLEDMGPKPNGFSLDRIDNNKGYSKENCRWATSKEQSDNRRIQKECLRGHKWKPETTIILNYKYQKTRRCKICYENRMGKSK